MASSDFKDGAQPFTMSVSEMAKMLNISRKSAYQMIHKKNFTAAIKVGKRILVIRNKLLKWIDEQAEKPLDGE